MTVIGSGATNGAGMVWLMMKVCTIPRRRRGGRARAWSRRTAMHVGWIDGGVLIVPQSVHRPPSIWSISCAPRANSALSGGTPIGIISPAGVSWPRARSTSA